MSEGQQVNRRARRAYKTSFWRSFPLLPAPILVTSNIYVKRSIRRQTSLLANLICFISAVTLLFVRPDKGTFDFFLHYSQYSGGKFSHYFYAFFKEIFIYLPSPFHSYMDLYDHYCSQNIYLVDKLKTVQI